MTKASATALTSARVASSLAVAIWLFICAGLVFAMVVLGGLTRLTDSGLSIVVWDVISGVMPPLNEAEWEETFAAYRQYPEYQKLNPDMTLAGFKSIFWLEYLHRLLGRLIGVVFFIPFVIFLARRLLSPRFSLALLGIFLLGAAQGVLGWYMVQSGLGDKPDVSQYRLAAHLALAVLIYGLLLSTAFRLVIPERIVVVDERRGNRAGGTYLAAAFVFLTMISGALMAGLNAGLIFNTFPLMDGRWIPEDLLNDEPWYINFGENVINVHFVHRCFALATTVVVFIAWLRNLRLRAIVSGPEEAGGRGDWIGHLMLLALVSQVALGVATVIYYVPLQLAILHQAGAMALLTACLWLATQQSQRREVVL